MYAGVKSLHELGKLYPSVDFGGCSVKTGVVRNYRS